MRGVRAWFVIWMAAGAAGSGAQTESLLGEVPQNPDEIASRVELAERRLAELAPATQPAEGAESPVVEARRGLYEAWSAYRAALEAMGRAAAEVARLSAQEYIEAVSERVSQLEREAERARRVAEEPAGGEETVARVEREAGQVKTEIDRLVEEQRERAALLGAGYETRREALSARLRELAQQRAELAARINAAAASTQPAERESLEAARERVEVETATVEVQLATVELERRAAELASQQAERLLAALREKHEALTGLASRLGKARSRSRLEALREARQRVTDAKEALLIDLQLLSERVLLHFFRGPGEVEAVRRRARSAALDRLKERVALSRAVWERALRSAGYRSGEEILALQEEAREREAEFRGRLSNLRQLLGDILRQIQDLQVVRERALQRFGSMVEARGPMAAGADAEQRLRFETEVTTIRSEFDEAMRRVLNDLDASAARVSEVIATVEEHVRFLAGVGQQLHWQRMARADSGLRGVDWRAAWKEALGLIGMAEPAERAALDERAALRRELLGEQRPGGRTLGELAAALGNDVGRMSGAQRLGAVVALVLAGIAGYALYRPARRRGVALAKEIEAAWQAGRREDAAAGVSAKIDLMGLNMVGDLAMPLLVLGAMFGAGAYLLEDEGVRASGAAVVGVVAAALTAWRLVHHVFEADSPPHRPLPCPDDVAKHYRWWLTALIVLTAVLLGAAEVMRRGGLGEALPAAATEVYKMAFLAGLVGFLARKRRVLGLESIGRFRWGFAAAAVLYPVAMAVVVGLLALEVAGYGALVSFAGEGLLLSVLVCVGAVTVASYVNDALRRYGAVQAGSGDSGGRGKGVVWERPASGWAAGLRWAVRVAAVAGVAAALVVIWRIPVGVEWVRPTVAGLVLLTAVVAFVADRVLCSAVMTLHARGRLPLTTATIIRRWLRGGIGVLAVLAVVAIAGFQVESIWQLLTAALAMVAIGFVAVWSILSNILATLVILIWRPFYVGERIEILPEGIEGQVVDINFIYTVLKSGEGTRVSVPNNVFAQKFIRRHSGPGVHRRSLAEQLEADQPLE